jgi:hypothetical protein
MKQKVVLLKELHRAIIYTTEISKQVTKSHVRMQFTVYLANEAARFTGPLRGKRKWRAVQYLKGIWTR